MVGWGDSENRGQTGSNVAHSVEHSRTVSVLYERAKGFPQDKL